MSGIFISYRRQDSAGHTGRLLDWLVPRFREEMIFRDLESIAPGKDFVKAIEEAIASCNVLLAVIGREWLSCVDNQGGKRLQNPSDLVRAEIRNGLARSIPLIPILVQAAPMPSASDLPDDLKGLATLNAFELSDRRWQTDCSVLGDQISSLLHNDQPQSLPGRDDRRGSSKPPEGTIVSIGRGLRIKNSTIDTIAASIVKGNGLIHIPTRHVSILEGAEVTGSTISEIVGFKSL